MLIVFEGTDGVGKTTQADMLEQRLLAEGKTVKRWKFPNYESNTGKLITRYLNNEFGPAADVDPHLASSLYALDRAAHKDELIDDIEVYDYVILDRYYYSNIALQGSKHLDKFDDIFQTIMGIENFQVGLPKPDKVILLHMDAEVIINSLASRGKESSVAKDGKLDGHESSSYMLLGASNIYSTLAGRLGWTKINCSNSEGRISPIELASAIYYDIEQTERGLS